MTTRQLARLPGRYEATRAFFRKRFLAHAAGPCGEAGCSVDPRLANAQPRRREAIALRDYIEHSREWERDRNARRVLSRLPHVEAQRLREFSEREYGRRGRRRWRTLLETIARDLRLFGGVSVAGVETLPTQAEGLAMSPDLARKVWRMYQRQAWLLLGEAPASPLVRALHKRFGARLTQLPRGRVSTYAELGAKLSPEQRERAWGAVLHWFHHAFRNLVRYRDGHPPRPRAEDCVESCRAAVAKWQRGLQPMRAPSGK